MRTRAFRRGGLPLLLLVVVAACATAQAYVPGAGRGLGLRGALAGEDAAALRQSQDAQVEVQARGLAPVTVSAGGMERTFYLHVPAVTDPSRPAPLVLAFHGGGGDAAGFADRSGLMAMADREGFLIAFPQGVRDSWNSQGRPAVGYASRSGIDDVAFARAVIDTVSASYAVDPARIFAVGMSAGGMMAYTLACDMPDRIAAIAVVAGTLTDESCAGVSGVSLLHIHGSNDQNVPLAGGAGSMSANRANWPPVMAGISLFETRNQCAASGSVSTPASDTLCETHACGGGETVVYCEVTPGGHAWPGADPARWQERNDVYVSPYFDATAQIAAFLRSR